MRARSAIRLGVAALVATLVALALPGGAAPQAGNIVVDTTADGNDGECANDCTLREAIAAADGTQGQFVSVPSGVYRLTLGPLVLQNDFVFGVSVVGNYSAGARTTVIDARGASRAFQVPSGSSSSIYGMTLTGGNAPAGGAALVESGGQLQFYDAIIGDNVASQRGGAIHNAGNLSVFFSTLSGNRGGSGGAIASEPGSNTSLYASTLSGNNASGNGGGITTAGSLTLQHVTIAGNSAGVGGGLYHEAADSGTGLWSTILAGNPGGDCGGAVVGARSITSANLAGDTTCQFASAAEGTVADPQLGALRNNSGPTDTRAIPADSPAVNAGDPNLCSPGASQDQRHATSIGNCDIGAFEYGATPPQAQLPEPVAGETVNVNRARGTVLIKIPGSDEFFELRDGQQVPVGSTFDTSKGRVNLNAAGQQQAWFYQGVFKLGQKKGAKPLSTLSLTGKLSCGGGQAIAAAKKKRRLWGDGKGKFRTKGKHSAATVVGTRWLVEDRCNGTLTKVTKGRVRVRAGSRTIVLKKGEQFFARAR